MDQRDPRCIADAQRVALADLLAHAADTVTFYSDRLGDREEVRRDPYQVLSSLPIITKSNIQQSTGELTSSSPRGDTFLTPTGGSTGQMLHVLQDEEFLSTAHAQLTICAEWCGYHVGDRQLFLWGSDGDIRLQRHLRTAIANCLTNARFVNTFDLDDDAMARACDTIMCWQPSFIWGYASSAAMFAEHLLERDMHFQAKAVQTTAEVLYPEQRTLIERGFRCPVFNRYGCREVSIIAHECEAHDGLHLFETVNYVELLDSDELSCPAGKVGRIIVTNLTNFAMPLIRYETGDLATVVDTPCRCGRPGRRLARIVGRTVDTILAPSGKRIHGEFFTHLFYGVSGVAQFQVVQRGQTDLILRVVPANDAERPDLTQVLDACCRLGEPEFHVSVEWVSEIPVLPSGKRQFIVSELE
ncbi:MAG: phenylacetate--CoA ligase family protein [Planctomycetes bacterium]|nr:phenylacetate--CoA ligase family protein [Planctomycetota bacterium]